MLEQARTKRNIGPITGLRLFAALYVLLLHSGSAVIIAYGVPDPARNFLRGGQLGVAFFFVLSGFVLTYTYGATGWQRESLREYGWARVARIVPVYLLSLLIGLYFFAKVATPAWTIGTLLFVQSWVPASSFHGTPWNGLAWTLSVEAFFYLSLPLLLWSTRSWTQRGLLIALSVTAIVVVALKLPTTFPDPNGHPFAFEALYHVPYMLLRVPEFFGGVLLARLFLTSRRTLSDWWLGVAIVGTVVVLSLSMNGYVRSVSAIGFGAIIFCAASASGPLARALGSKIMLLLGGASYGIYIFQGVLHQWIDKLLGTGDAAELAVWPTVIGFSIVVFILFEEPARRGIRRRVGAVRTPSPTPTR